MKFLTKKKNVQKIIIAFLFLILFNFIVPTYSRADAGGILSAPVVGLLCVICDGVNGIMAKFMVGDQNESVYPEVGSQEANDYIAENPYEDDGLLPTVIIDKEDFLGDYGIPNFIYTPAQIFSGKLPSLDVNFFREDVPDIEDEPKSIVAHLRGIVSSWYVALRNLAVVGLLSVLIYLGIRLVLTSSNPEKAKYKQSITDWIVAMCLIFFLHYIMAFTMTITESITDMITNDDINGQEVYIGILATVPQVIEGESNVLTQDQAQEYLDAIDKDASFATTLMGATRIQCEYKDGSKKWGYLILYMALTIYTIMFTVTYLKRLINMIFLTIIAPLVALTYPIDKAGDSKAQAFSFWLKEYVYNALLQPVHLLLYTVLVTSALSLAASNMLYAIVALAFILPSEKILRQMFNFRNSATGESLGGFAGGMLAKGLLDNIARGGKSKSPNAGGKNKVRTANTPLPKDPNAPSGAGALVGADTLIPGSPMLSQSAEQTGNANNSPIGATAAMRTGATDSTQGTQGQERGDANSNVTGEGRELTDDERMIRDNLQGMIEDPNTLDEDKEEYQRQLDYYNNLEGRHLDNNNNLEEGRPLTDDERMIRDNLQGMVDDPNTSEEDREEYQRQLDYYNRLENGSKMKDNSNGQENTTGGNTVAQGQNARRAIRTVPNVPPTRPAERKPITGVRKVANKAYTSSGIRGIGAGIRNVARKAYTDAGGASGIAKTMARGAIKASSMAGGAAVGVAAGITTGNLDDIGKYAIGGVMAGGAIGNNIANRVEGVVEGAQGVVNTFNEGRYTRDELAEKQLKKHEKEFKSSYENRQYFKNNFKDKTDRQIDTIMDRAAVFSRNGLRDLDRIKDAIKLEDGLMENARQANGGTEPTEELKTMAHNQALTLAKIRADLGEAGFNDYKRVESRKAALKRQLTNNGLDEATAEKRTNDSFDFMEKTLNT